MKILLIVSLLLSIVLCHGDHSSHKPEDPTPGVIDITSSNVDEVITTSKHALVEFYAPWCGHCKTLAPELVVFGEAFLKAKPQDAVIGKVDCTKEQSICSKYGVNGIYFLKFRISNFKIF
jgi:protein disulfide-isomerase A6